MNKNVLMISLDPSVFSASAHSDTQQRHIAYAEALAHHADGGILIILVPVRDKAQKELWLSPSCLLIPAFTPLRVTMFFSLLKKGRAILKKYPLHTVTTQSPFDDGLAGHFLAKQANGRFIPQIRGDIFSRYFLFEHFPFTFFLFPLAMWLLRDASAIQVVSHTLKDSLQKRRFTAPIVVIPSLISFTPSQRLPEARSAFRSAQGLREHATIFLFVGNLLPAKNIPFLLTTFTQALRAGANAQLIIAGDGPERKHIGAWKQRNPEYRDALVTPGLVLHADIGPWYAAADVFVLASHYEGLPRVLREAARSGLPIITTRVSGADELVENEKNGFLCDQGDVKTFVHAMLRLSTDALLRRQYGEYSREHERKTFDSETLLKKRVSLWIDPLP